jgi:ABC-2 type transport system permease protein
MKYAKLYLDYFKQDLKSLLANRGDFIIQFVTIFLYQLLGLIFIGIIFSKVPQIKGWSFYEVLFIFGFFNVVTGFFYMHFAWTLWFPNSYIINRGLDALLTRPLNPYFQLIAEELGNSIQEIFSLLLGIAIMIFAAFGLGLEFNFLLLIYLAVGLLCGVLILGGLFTALTSLAFWIKGTASVASPLMSLMDFAQYPLTIYNKILRFIFTFILPFGFLAFYPGAAVLRAGYGDYILLGIGLALVFFLGGYGLFNRGLRRYESAGS